MELIFQKSLCKADFANLRMYLQLRIKILPSMEDFSPKRKVVIREVFVTIENQEVAWALKNKTKNNTQTCLRIFRLYRMYYLKAPLFHYLPLKTHSSLVCFLVPARGGLGGPQLTASHTCRLPLAGLLGGPSCSLYLGLHIVLQECIQNPPGAEFFFHIKKYSTKTKTWGRK